MTEEEIYNNLKGIEEMIHQSAVYLNRNISNPQISKPKTMQMNVKGSIGKMESALFFAKKCFKELKKIRY